MNPNLSSRVSPRPRGRYSRLLLGLFFASLFLSACATPVKKDFTLAPDFHPQNMQTLAVVNLDPQIRFSHFVEAELLKKGYRVKEGSAVGQFLKNEGLVKDNSLELSALSRIGSHLQVQGVVLCSVLEFSRFRDSYRLSIRCVAPDTGNTLWYAEGAKNGRKGEKSSDILKDIVVSSLKGVPAIK
jgi:hypothetical protein